MNKKLILMLVMILLALLFVSADELFLQTADNENLGDARPHAAISTQLTGDSPVNIVCDTGNIARTYITFNNLSALPETTDISLAQIGMVRGAGGDNTKTVYVHHVNGTATWNEDIIHWDNQICGTDNPINDSTKCNITAESAVTTFSQATGLVIWNVTSAVKRAVAAGDDNVSFVFAIPEAGEGDSRSFMSKEGATPGSFPYLNITYTIGPPDTTPPGLLDDDAWCTSCSPVQKIDNQPWETPDATPTVNATINESATCSIIGANTTVPNYNYTDAIAKGGIECSTTGVADQICTIQSSNAFNISEDNYICVGCKDGETNELLNATFCANMNISQATLRLDLDGLNQSRKYEFGSKATISASYDESSTICINLTAPYYGGNYSCGINPSFVYNITTLRQTEFSNGSFASSNGLNVSMNNKTKMVKTYLNVTSSGTTTNLNISYYGHYKNYTGDLIGKYLKQTEFIHLGVYKDAVNLTYLTAGSNYIYTDIPTNVNNLTFELTGFDLDIDNEFSYIEHVNHSVKINNTLSYHVDTLGYLDDFTVNSTETRAKWNLEDGSGTGTLAIGSGYLETVVVYPNNKYLRYTDLAGDLRNSSRVEIIQYAEFFGPSGDVPGGSGLYSFEAFDGTNKIVLYEDSVYIGKAGGTFPRGVKNFTLIKNSEDYKSWELYINGTLAFTKDLSSLDFNNQIELQFYLNPGNTITDTIRLFDVRWSGIFLNRSTNNGTYKSSGNFTSKVLNVTKTNISRVLVSWAKYEPDGTKITGYASNNCLNPSYTFEEVQSDLMHVFTTQTVDSNKLCVRFNLNSSVNITSPVVRKYEADIIPSSIKNISIDLEDDGTVDWEYIGILNSTTSPKHVNFTSIPTGNDITIKISAVTAGQIQVDNFVLNNSLNPIELNYTYFEDCYNCTIDFEFSGNSITVSGLEFDFYGSWNYTALAWYSDMIDEHLIQIYYSDFNISYPEGYEWYDISAAQNDSNVTPYGQTDSTPIWNVSKLAYDEDINIYIKTNKTIDNCLNITLSNNSKREVDVVNETFKWQNNTAIQLANKNILNETIVVFNQTDIIHNPVVNETFTWFNATPVKLNYGNLSDDPIVVFNQTDVFQYKRVNESFIWWNTTKVQLYIQENLINNTAIVFNQTDGKTIGSNNYTVDYALGTILLLSTRQNLTKINESIIISIVGYENYSLLSFSEIIHNNDFVKAVNVSLILSNESLTWSANNSAMMLNYGNLTIDSEILYNNGTKVNKGTNYTMNYTNGSITFTNSSTYWNGTNKELITNKLNLTYTYTAYSILLNREIDYRINYTYGNLTLINASFNNSELFVSYNYTIRLPFGNGKQFGINYSYTVYNGTPIADSSNYLINYSEGTITLITNYKNNTQFGINYTYLSKNSSITVGSGNYSINPIDGTINLTSGYGDGLIFGINYTYLTYGYDYGNDFTFKLNTSYQQIIANISASKGIWSWENYYSCGFGLNWTWFYFASVCEGCYYDESQLDYYNIIVE